jgi:hypothetical protein
MDVKNRLTRRGISIGHDPETILGNTPLPRNVSGNPEDVTDELVVGLGQGKNALDMLARYQEQVQGGRRVDILNRHQPVVLINDPCRNLTGDNLAEKTGHQPTSLTHFRLFSRQLFQV